MCRYMYIVYMGACCWPPVTPSLLRCAALKTGRIQSTSFFPSLSFSPQPVPKDYKMFPL